MREMNDPIENELLASGSSTPIDLYWNSDIEEGVKSAENDILDDPFSFNDKQNDGKGDSEESRKRRTPPAMFGASGGMAMVPVTRRKKKPKGMPKRPLTVYNVFFQQERPKIIAEEEEKAKDDPFPQRKIKFEDLGRIVAKRWKDVSEVDRQRYETLAEEDTFRYRKEMKAYNEDNRKREEEEKEREKKKGMGKPASQEEKRSHTSPPAPLASLPISTSQGMAPPLLTTYFNLSTPLKARIPGMPAEQASPKPSPPPPTPQFLSSSDLVGSNVRPLPPLPPHQQTASDAYPQPWQQNGNNQFGRHSSMADMVPSASGTVQRPAPATHPVHQQLQNPLPVPPGTILTLPDSSGRDRKYTVKYSCYSMSRKEAQEYLRSFEAAETATGKGPASSPAAAVTKHHGESLFVPLAQSAHSQPQAVLGQQGTHPRGFSWP